ncbi:hypothetical protein TREMEDRAFT_31876 [Tremella mesenterica DSM 1558]|uniref:uncharacterized protein n=1 Tax=Tremella mesenterica (strain ATCC 24925 / CBS 8224 / DSM 1558 / NBRC 9311 / NRRL Y-6157 / RJB 2259-6 / UBC 559-6) TaxID=578456 RepID=UPI0003F4A0F5|nr:uncharacterized protein TREMEDRAFT_31876 [Tremella mesenterica DSM 1558]EIW68637.1 hypothetical protein TREMEDRAFT_31876 [Tremella mesenterica DSM 1558]
MSDVEYLKSLLGVHPDFPKKGITFLDIFPILQNPIAFETLITHIVHHILITHPTPPDIIVGLDARGFLLGPMIASRLKTSFVPVRKGGKLPGETENVTYDKEYGKDVFEIQKGSVGKGSRCLVIDDLIATGGSAAAAGQLIEKSGGVTIEYIFIISLPFLKGEEKLNAPCYSLIQAED